jgi:hypothetical protein
VVHFTFDHSDQRTVLGCHFRSCSDIRPDLVRCAIEDLVLAPNTHIYLVSAINELILKVCTIYQAVLAISRDMQSTFVRELEIPITEPNTLACKKVLLGIEKNTFLFKQNVFWA